MKLTDKKLYFFIAFAVISLLGIILIQYAWIDNALTMEGERFNRVAEVAISDVSNEIRQDTDIIEGLNIIRATQLPQANLPPPDENQKLEVLVTLQAKIDSTFKENNFIHDFEFGVFEPFNVTHPDSHINAYLATLNFPVPTTFNEEDHKYLIHLGNLASISFNFPDIDSYFARQISLLLILSVVFIIMASICFGYIIITLKKQKELSELKDDFVNNVTHEFKTPIFSISLAAKMLSKSEQVSESDKLKKYTTLIKSENNKLQKQVDKILQAAVLDSNNFQLEKKELDFHDLIIRVCNSFSVIIDEADGRIDFELNAGDKTLFGDEDHISTMIYNLIDNAIKYSLGKPEITIITEENKKGVCLIVKDKGIGIDPDSQASIFEKFYRAQSGDIHDTKGFGLGLSYVKRVADAHKAIINLKSVKGKGSQFSITFPT